MGRKCVDCYRGLIECFQCGGIGYQTMQDSDIYGPIEVEVECTRCNGKGMIKGTCLTCGGTGVVKDKE